MSDLTDALEWWNQPNRAKSHEPEVATLAAAAERLADAEVWQWCEVHKATAPDFLNHAQIATCWRWVASQTVDDLPDEECSMVYRRLLKPEKE